MIFVSVGTNEARFDRLLEAVAGLPLGEEVFVQHGHSSPLSPPGGRTVDFLSFEAMVETIRAARVVVTHAGVGSVMVALANGKRPVVFPRRKSFREAVDDHQLQLGRRFAAAGLVTLVETPEALGNALRAGGDGRVDGVAPEAGRLAEDLRRFVGEAVARRPSAA